MKPHLVLFLSLILTASTMSTQAQAVSHRGELPGAIAEALGLTESQIAELQAMRENLSQQGQAAREVYRDSTVDARAALRVEVCAIRAQREQALDAILTPEQRQDLALIEAVREARREERRGGHREPVTC